MVQLAKLSDYNDNVIESYKVKPDLGYKETFGFYRNFRVSLHKPDKNIFDTFMWIKRNGMEFLLKLESYCRNHKVRENLTAYKRYNMNTLADYVDLDWWWY